jgi:hypothetical protein
LLLLLHMCVGLQNVLLLLLQVMLAAVTGHCCCRPASRKANRQPSQFRRFTGKLHI